METDKYYVYIEPQADRRLAVHMEFLARVSERVAIRLYEEYKKSLNFLASSPRGCPVYIPKIPIETQLRYKLFGKRYRIVFEILRTNV